jgi:hypothetical protein
LVESAIIGNKFNQAPPGELSSPGGLVFSGGEPMKIKPKPPNNTEIVAITLLIGIWLMMHSNFSFFQIKFLGSEVRIERQTSLKEN